MTYREARAARIQIQNQMSDAIHGATGFSVEVTIGHSAYRGDFVSLCGTIEALDAARPVMEAAERRLAERDIDPDDDVQVDYYTL